MSFLCENHFQLANSESLTTPDSPIRSLVVIVLKLKSQLSSFENLRGIVRPLNLSEVKSLSKPKSLSMSKKRTVPQRFFNANLSLFSFSTMPANGRRLGAGRGSQMLVRVRTLERPTGLSAGIHPALCQTACWVLLFFYSCTYFFHSVIILFFYFSTFYFSLFEKFQQKIIVRFHF